MKNMYYPHHLRMERFGKKINKICEPFFIQHGISYFLYQKITKEGLLCALNTDQNYSGTYLDLDQLDSDILMTYPENINVGTLILSSTLLPLDEQYYSYDNILGLAMKKFNYDHGLALFYKKIIFLRCVILQHIL